MKTTKPKRQFLWFDQKKKKKKSVFAYIRGLMNYVNNKTASKYLNLHTLYPNDKVRQNKMALLGMKGENMLLISTIFIKNLSPFKK